MMRAAAAIELAGRAAERRIFGDAAERRLCIPKATELLRHRSQRSSSDINSCVRSMPRDETSVGLIAQQGLIKQLGYEIIEEEE